MKSLIVICAVIGLFFVSPSFAQEPPKVEQDIDQAFDQIEAILKTLRRELPEMIERFERLQKELEKPLPPSKPPTIKLPDRDI